MSNYLAIATVTAALKELIQTAIQVVPGKDVRVGRPEDLTGDELARYGANLYLYQVTPNASLRNQDLATRNSDGTLIQQPQVALDLNYWIAFYSPKKDTQLETERMLGNVVSVLHAYPVITSDQLSSIIDSPSYSYLSASDIDKQIEQVRLMPITLTLEELSKLWTVFNQASHRLSLFYQASVVLISPDVSPQPSLPTSSPKMAVAPHPVPTISKISPERVEFSAQAQLTIQGENWGSGDVSVLIDGQTVSAQRTSPSEIQTSLPTDIILAGTHYVQVMPSDQSATGSEIRSNSVIFVLQPSVANTVQFATVQLRRLKIETDPSDLTPETIDTVALTLAPEIGLNQSVELLLNEFQTTNSSAKGYTFTKVLQFDIDSSYETDLNNGTISSDLQQVFYKHLLPLDSNASVTASGNNRWLIQNQTINQSYAIRASQNRLLVNYGLANNDNDMVNRTVVQVSNVTSGNYLVRLKLVGTPGAESPLSTNANGLYVAPQVSVP